MHVPLGCDPAAGTHRAEQVFLVLRTRTHLLLFHLIVGIAAFLVASCHSGGGGGGGNAGGGGGSTAAPAPASVDTVVVSPNSLAIVLGQSRPLTATPRDAAGNALAGRSVTWTSGQPTVATVSETGVVTGVAAGLATITATVEGKEGIAATSVAALGGFVQVAAGQAHTCALTDAGVAYCWGRGEGGQLGAAAQSACPLDGGNFPCELTPVAVGGGLNFSWITAGNAHTCALTADGIAYCWGSNTNGQLGDNSTEQRGLPTAVATQLRFASLDAGANHTCGVTTTGGAAYCWGRNNRGQLGNGNTTDSSVPVAVAGVLTFQSVTAGGFNIGHACGVVSSGGAYCWGDNERGQLGGGGPPGPPDVSAHPLPAPVAGGLTFASLTAGLGRHTCGRTAAGVAYCWGEGGFGALGDGTFFADRSSPGLVSGGRNFYQLIAGGFIGHTCGLSDGGAAYCWGENERGAIGDGTTLDRSEPSPVAGSLAFVTLDAGARHTCAIATSGELYCWGSGAAGQLGIDSRNQSDAPAKVHGQP